MSAKIAAALHQVMTKVSYVQKTGKNTFHGYKYAGEADLLDKLRPAMIEAGLMLIPSQREASNPDAHGNVNVQIEYTLIHKDGDVWPEKIAAFGCGNDMSPKTGRIGDKGLYKAITGANKYLLFKLFQIETGDDPEVDNKIETEAAPPRAVEPVAKINEPAPSAALSKLIAGTKQAKSIQAYDAWVARPDVNQAIEGLSKAEKPEWFKAVETMRKRLADETAMEEAA